MAQIRSRENTPEESFDEQWRLSHLEFCLDNVKHRVPEKTWQAFELLADNATVSDVGKALGLNDNQVYKAKSKVLKLVRERFKSIYADQQ